MEFEINGLLCYKNTVDKSNVKFYFNWETFIKCTPPWIHACESKNMKLLQAYLFSILLFSYCDGFFFNFQGASTWYLYVDYKYILSMYPIFNQQNLNMQ